ncbi:MAG: hypothetical protein ACLPZM_04590 [Thermoplasmata archaeon]
MTGPPFAPPIQRKIHEAGNAGEVVVPSQGSGRTDWRLAGAAFDPWWLRG